MENRVFIGTKSSSSAADLASNFTICLFACIGTAHLMSPAAISAPVETQARNFTLSNGICGECSSKRRFGMGMTTMMWFTTSLSFKKNTRG